MEISLKLSLQLFFPLILSYNLFAETLPLSQRYFHHTDMGYDYNRGTYLIVLADESLEPILLDEDTGDFIHFKNPSQESFSDTCASVSIPYLDICTNIFHEKITFFGQFS